MNVEPLVLNADCGLPNEFDVGPFCGVLIIGPLKFEEPKDWPEKFWLGAEKF